MVTGWVERNEGDKFYGWISLPAYLLEQDVSVMASEGANPLYIKPVKVSASNRPDLAGINCAHDIAFELDAKDFYWRASTCSVQLAILCGNQEYPLPVTPQLIYRALRKNMEKRGGLEFGRISTDGAAVVGAGGTIFLKTGSNDVESMYGDANNIDIDGWVSLLLNRYRKSAEKGCKFLQIFVPEKSSVLYWSAPFDATKGSQSYNNLVSVIASHPLLSEIVISNNDYLPDEVHSEGVFRAFDTHLSTYGVKLIVDKFLEQFVVEEGRFYELGAVFFGEAHGDIGARFLEDGEVIEKPPLYTGLYDRDGGVLEPILTYSFDPADGNIGVRRSWKCHNAPIQKKVVCFGGSSFERGEVSSTMSWWFSRLFREFHFVWSPRFTTDLIDEVCPDIVVCQSIERFLNALPVEESS